MIGRRFVRAIRACAAARGALAPIGALSLIATAGCLSAGTRATASSVPKRCSYRVSRRSNVPSVSAPGALHRAVITAMVTDSAGQPVPSASVARMSGGPGAYTDAQGRAVFRLSEHDVMRADSTDVVVRRVGYAAMHVPVRVTAGDSIDIAASMCASHAWLEESTAGAPVHDHGALGVGIGAIAGSIVGYRYELGGCDLIASRCTGVHGAAGGAVVGALLGYTIGHFFTSRSACMPADAESAGMVAEMRRIVDTTDLDYASIRKRWKVPAAPTSDVHLVTDERMCRHARQALDSLIHATDPKARGLRRIPSVYVIRAGNLIDVETPGSSASNLFDATTWKFLGALVVPD